MKSTIIGVLASLVIVPATTFAQEVPARSRDDSDRPLLSAPAPPMTLREATNREAVRLATASAVGQKASLSQQSWARRHPAAVGALAGFGVGFVAGEALCPSSDCGVSRELSGVMLGGMFAAIGSGVGALVGWLTSR